jgi:hypothetical protein
MRLACVCCWDLALKPAFARSSGQRPGSRGGKSTEPSLRLMNFSWKLVCELECTHSFGPEAYPRNGFESNISLALSFIASHSAHIYS